ncbi:MAG: M28 family peptidase [Gemmatimonadota bacterium]
MTLDCSRTAWVLVGLCCLVLPAVTAQAPSRPAQFPALAAIRERDIRRDIDLLAGDAMRGREAGSLDELRAAAWIADRARNAGLAPAGNDGTYFQFWSMRRTVMAAASKLTAGGDALELGRDFAVQLPTNAHIDAETVYLDAPAAAAAPTPDLTGKVVVVPLRLGTPVRGAADVPIDIFAAIGRHRSALRDAGLGSAAALVVLGDPGDPPDVLQRAIAYFMLGSYGLDTGAVVRTRTMPVLLVPNPPSGLRTGGQRFVADLFTTTFSYPSVNVVARVSGTDPARRAEFVVYSSHIDHDGVRPAVGTDSIWNGADDNASTSVAILAVGRAFAAHPAPRSALFIWHGAEEKGLIGSRWHALHPVVPIGSMVAVINGDLIGRNSPDSMGLLGSQPPHRNSAELVDMALRANAAVGHFALDSLWDRASHAERWYFRSDHVSYAELGVPALHFSSLTEPDYHTPFDEPSRINTAKLTRVSRWMYATGWLAATAARRPASDPNVVIKSIIR